ncbi:synaptonemal complex protein 2-like isoform X4 [Biomphalaria glabrata]|uniref:Synaptonemal complex protein 2-like isoform X4 n=1 Tax=Biomphalaria glabrata TaxID=6526 RepID=A0A9W3AHZ0_BIOGL|nr:synaptonemal complex protein 2-like isoform X4 [Biomphalaria glabrata]
MDQQVYSSNLPSKVASVFDIKMVEDVLTDAIFKLQNAHDESSFLLLMTQQTINIVSDTFKILQNYCMPYCIDNIISKITDLLVLANDGGKAAKDVVVKSVTEPCINLILSPSFMLLHKIEILKSMNAILQNCSAKTKQELLVNNALSKKLQLVVEGLVDVGDFEYQVCIIEYFFRLVPKNLRADFTEKLIGDETFQLGLLNICDTKFETDCRYFLNKQNAKSKTNTKRIYSIPAECVKIDGTKIYKPSDEGYDEFWVDFNTGSKRIGIFCEPNFLSSQQSQDEELWETISIWAKDVKKYTYTVKDKLKTAYIEIRPGAQILGSRCDGQAHLVVIGVSQDYDLQAALDRTLRTELKVSSVDVPVVIHGNQDPQKLQRFEQMDMSQTSASSLSINSSVSKFKVSIPLNPMITPAQSVTQRISPPTKTSLKGVEESPVKILKLQVAPVDTILHIKSENRSTIPESNNKTQDGKIEMSISKKVSESLTPTKTAKIGKKFKTPVVNVTSVIKKIKGNLSDKIPLNNHENFNVNEPFDKFEKEIPESEKNSEIHFLRKQKSDGGLTRQSLGPASERKRKNRNKENFSLLTKSTGISKQKLGRKNFSPENLSFEDFKLPKKTSNNKDKKKTTHIPAKSEKKSKHAEQFDNEINMHMNVRNCALDHKTNSKNDIEKIADIGNYNILPSDSMLIEPSPRSCIISSLSASDVHIDIENSKKVALNDVVAETQSQTNVSEVENQHKIDTLCKVVETIDSSGLWSDQHLILNSSAKKSIHNLVNSPSMLKTCDNLLSGVGDSSAGVEHSYIFNKTEILKDKAQNPPLNTSKSKNGNLPLKKKEINVAEVFKDKLQNSLLNTNNKNKKILQKIEARNMSNKALKGKLKMTPLMTIMNKLPLQGEETKTASISIQGRNLRERKKPISYKEVETVYWPETTSETKPKSKKVQQKSKSVNEKTLKSDIKNIIPSKSTKSNFKSTQEENNLGFTSKRIIQNEPLCHGVWTKQKVEKTITTMSFSGLLSKNISTDPYDFDAECSIVSGNTSLLPNYSNTIAQRCKKSFKVQNIKNVHKKSIDQNKNCTKRNIESYNVKDQNSLANVKKKEKLELSSNYKKKESFKMNQEKNMSVDNSIDHIDNSLTTDFIVTSHASDSKSPSLDNSIDIYSGNQGLVFPPLEDSIPCTPFCEQAESPTKSLCINSTSQRSEISWIKQPLKENIKKPAMTYQIKNHQIKNRKISPKSETPTECKKTTKRRKMKKKETNASPSGVKNQNNGSNFSSASKHTLFDPKSKHSPANYFDTVGIQDVICINKELEGRTWSIISAQINSQLKDALSTRNSCSDSFVSPLDIVNGFTSDDTSTMFGKDTSQEQPYLDNSVLEKRSSNRNKQANLHTHKEIKGGLQKASNKNFSMHKVKKTEVNSQVDFSSYCAISPEKGRKKVDDLRLVNRFELSPLSPIVSSPLKSPENISNYEESPVISEIKYGSPETQDTVDVNKNVHFYTEVSEQISNQKSGNTGMLRDLFIGKNDPLPKLDDDLQNIMTATCKFLHSAWDSEQKDNVTAAERFQELTQKTITSLNKDLQEIKKTEENVKELWEQGMKKYKQHRLCQETELRRLRLAHQLLEQNLFHNKNNKTGQEMLQSALKQDMNTIQKKIFTKINKNSLDALRRCLKTSSMMS